MATESSRTGTLPPPTRTPTIGAQVRSARKQHGLTQGQLAGLAGTGMRFVSDLENGKPNVALDKVVAVLAVLGLELKVVGGQS